MAADRKTLGRLCGVDTGWRHHLPAGRLALPGRADARRALALAQRQGLVCRYRHTRRRWRVKKTAGVSTSRRKPPPTVITASGHRLAELAPTQVLPLYSVRGRVAHIQARRPSNRVETPVLCYDGYLTPVNANNDQHCIGASYQRGDTATDYREQGNRKNRERRCCCCRNRRTAGGRQRSSGAAACAAPPAIICRWSARCRTIRPR